MRSAFVIGNRDLHLYDFNHTYLDAELQRVGLVLVDRQAKAIKELSVYKNLTITTKSVLPAQIIKLNFSNDYSWDQMRIYLRGIPSFPRWKVVLIVVFSIVGAAIMGALGFFAFRKIKARREAEPESRESLMTDST